MRLRTIKTVIKNIVAFSIAFFFAYVFVTMVFMINYAMGSEIETENHHELLDAICEVESNCQSDAVGDDGNAIGAYQIWYDYWYDAVTFSSHDDLELSDEYKSCYDKEYSEKVVLAYWDRYATINRLGRTPTNQDLARIHNGGPNGYKKNATVGYWNKVKARLYE